MDSKDFIRTVPGFLNLSKVEQTILLAWHLHTHHSAASFTSAQLRSVFQKASVEPPDLSVYLPRMVSKKPPQLRQTRDQYRLDEKLRQKLDIKYGLLPTTIAVTSLLESLPSKIPNMDERVFLVETLNCYRVKAYRAATVMAWNLAFDHLRQWILKDPARLSAFNASLAQKYKNRSLTVSRVEHFEEMKEFEVVETIKHAKLVSENITGILKEKLGKRNRAAHPSNLEVTQLQADDTITDLVNNVVIHLV